MYFDRDMSFFSESDIYTFSIKNRFLKYRAVVVTPKTSISRSKYIEKRSPLEIILLYWSSLFAQNMSPKHLNCLEDLPLP